jgi:polysaccharide pyruvyl transferase WcaK-like protein
MKILHTYCLNHNIGDYYLGIGVKNLLRRYLDVELIAETNLQGTVFNEYYIDNVVNKKYDLLVIGGGGIIHGAHWPNGWFWLIKQELIKQIKIPFVVYGVGYNYFKDEEGIPETGKHHLAETIERAAYFSVRNDGSQSRLYEQLGIDVPVVPDPGFHINLDREFLCDEKEPYVLIQLANDKPEYRFPETSGNIVFVEQMRDVITKLASKYKVILSPHVYEDVELSKQVTNGIKNSCVWDFSKYAFDRCRESIGLYKDAQFVLAMRGHGQIVPIAYNTPVISIENHPKHIGLMRNLDIEEYNVSLGEPNFGKLLNDKISLLEKQRSTYVSHLSSLNKIMSEQSDYAFSYIKDKLTQAK